MPIAALVRRAWEGLLAGLPRNVLAWLDTWARHAAEKRAERRLRLSSRH